MKNKWEGKIEKKLNTVGSIFESFMAIIIVIMLLNIFIQLIT